MVVTSPTDQAFMREALREARRGLGKTSPNPAVGALLASDGIVIARGHHRRAGGPHAEIECLGAAGKRIPRSATLYVTLEPCSTRGRTPPCTDAIIASGVKRVVIGATDPNPRHADRAIEVLRAGGIEVTAGVLADECTKLNLAFNKWIQTGIPLVIAKCGMTLDGRLSTAPGEPPWITSPAARRHANRRRALVDAILVGAGTVRTDNPRLTVREVRCATQPWRVVLTRSGRLPRSAHLFTDAFAGRTIVLREQPLRAALAELGRREITSVLIEGGADVLGQALDAKLIDVVELYLAPMFTGGPVVAFAGNGATSTPNALRLSGPEFELIGDDVFMTATARHTST